MDFKHEVKVETIEISDDEVIDVESPKRKNDEIPSKNTLDQVNNDKSVIRRKRPSEVVDQNHMDGEPSSKRQKPAEETKQDQNDLFCLICCVQLPSQTLYKIHTTEERHLKLLDKHKKRTDRKCGVYVQNFAYPLFVDNLLNFFSKFGSIAWYHFRNMYLLIDYDQTKSAHKLIISKPLYVDGKVMTFKHRLLYETITDADKHILQSNEVRSKPAESFTPVEIKKSKQKEIPREDAKSCDNKYFCSVCNINITGRVAIAAHKNDPKHIENGQLQQLKDDTEYVDNKCGLSIKGKFVGVERQQILQWFSKFGPIVWHHFTKDYLLLDYQYPECAEQAVIDPVNLFGRRLFVQFRTWPGIHKKPKHMSNIRPKLQDAKTLKDQIQILEKNLHPQEPNVPSYVKVCDDLYGALSLGFSNHRVHRFGSTVTGLNFHTSDVDVYVYISNFQQPSRNEKSCLRRVESVLRTSRRFGSLIVIPAKIPILRCVHLQTRTSCDINVRNMLGVCNSKLVRAYLDIDWRLRFVMLFLKYSGKVHGFLGQSQLFTTYSLTLMYIFFLQHRPYSLPNISSLQADPVYNDYHDGWNGGFRSNLKHLCLFSSSTNIVALLSDFFSFYENYDFSSKVICPYLGLSVDKSEFINTNDLPDVYNHYKDIVSGNSDLSLKMDSMVCVQDPFEHTNNVTKAVTNQILKRFVSFCVEGKKECEKGEEFLLYRLLRNDLVSV